MLIKFVGAIKAAMPNPPATPRQAALSLAAGVALAFGPFPGFHILVALGLVRLLRLNPTVVLAGIFVHNPWTFLPIHFAGLAVGDFILTGHLNSIEQFGEVPWEQFGLRSFINPGFWEVHGHLFLDLLKPFVLGSLVNSAVFGALVYYCGVRWFGSRSVEVAAAGVEV